MKATQKEINRRLSRLAGGSRSDVWPGAKSEAHEIMGYNSPEWRREWIKRGLGFVALKGPVGRLP